LKDKGFLDEAIENYNLAITIKPDFADAYNNLGVAYLNKMELSQAEKAYRKAIAIDKNHAQAHFNLGFNLLLRGNYNQGWNEYEWRWQSHEVIFPKLNKPLWQGEDIKGKTILLVTEQGLGDAIQFIRYVPLIRDLGAKVKVDCQASLVELFKTVEGVSEVKSNHQVNEFDVYIPLMTLPRILQTTLATIPNQIPYLAAPKQVYSLPNTSDLKIGIVWATARENFTLYPKKSCSLEFFGRLLGIKGIKFYSLQVGPDREDIKFYQQSITDLSQYIDDFTATAGLISQLDLVISVDTAVAHLAGAMGKPVWLLLPFSPDWRWLCERNDSPWYPTLRLFRQPQPEDWGNVFMNIALELAKWVKDATFKVNLAYFANITPKSLANNLLQKSIKRKTINHQTIIDSLQANFTLAFQHYQARRLQEATRIYRHIISLETLHQDSAFKTTLARAYNNLGAMLIEQKLNSEAETAFENAINLLPNYAEAYYNLGRLFTEEGNFIEAEKQLRQAINLNSKFVDAYIYLGTALKSQGKFAEAVSYLEQALSFKPNSLEIYNNLGIYYHEQGLFPQAEAAFKKAISIQPDFADSHGNLGLQFLLCGDFYQGWAEYEWRLKTEELKVTVIKNKPLWDGSNPRGKTLLLIAEQGLGDTIQFVRYIPILQAMGATVKLVCDATLVELFVPIKGLTEVMAFNTVIQGSDFDFYVYLLSLPQILKTNLETIPQQIPYLHSPCTTYQLPNPSSFNIGFVWSTNKTTPKLYWKKRCKVEHFLQLLDIKNINLYSLQVGEDAVELQPYLQRDRLYDLSSQIKDFTDTAAIIEQLDLIISVDTAVAHLAGAMGKPVWNLLPFIPDWRWLLDRNDSPWYSTMKLFRQTTIGDWESVFSVIRQDLCVKSQKSEFRSQESKKGAINIKKIALSWPISLNSGWGVYGFNLILQLATKKNYQPLLLCPQPHADNCNPLHQYLLSPVFENQYQIQHFLNQPPGQKLALDALILYALGNDFSPSPFAERFQGKRNIGLIFFENTQLSQTALEKAQFYDLIIAGSRWNEEVLRGYGFNHVTTVIQGIDPTIFHPAPKSNLWGERFVIFSGGKLEYRKGQDIIVAAFKRFQQRHPEALLVTAWHNFWPQFMQGLETTGNVIGLPQVAADKRLGIKAWLIDNGIPAESIIDLGLLPNHLMGQILREADVAVFANRCEGGTNLAAMESLACGVPTILSTNTGHLDLVNQIPCYPLKSQKKVKPTALFPGVDGWGESSVEEILIHLETVYQHQQEAQKIGQAAAILMQNLTWEYQVNKLLFAMGLI
jgi:tetratricopeptide (TPR) repeat protein/glycosyltransferase involved in cell wall biosynthesis